MWVKRTWPCLAVCGGSVIASNGVIMSPHYPSSYDPNTRCVWNIRGPVGHYLNLHLTNLDLPSAVNGNCSTVDYVQIREQNATSTHKFGSIFNWLISELILVRFEFSFNWFWSHLKLIFIGLSFEYILAWFLMKFDLIINWFWFDFDFGLILNWSCQSPIGLISKCDWICRWGSGFRVR